MIFWTTLDFSWHTKRDWRVNVIYPRDEVRLEVESYRNTSMIVESTDLDDAAVLYVWVSLDGGDREGAE